MMASGWLFEFPAKLRKFLGSGTELHEIFICTPKGWKSRIIFFIVPLSTRAVTPTTSGGCNAQKRFYAD
jgi:hypothetical protein